METPLSDHPAPTLTSPRTPPRREPLGFATRVRLRTVPARPGVLPALFAFACLVAPPPALSGGLRAQEPAGDGVVKMEPFNVAAYNGNIPLIDGFTGQDYEGTHVTVIKFAQSFNKLLLGYHKKLVLDEVKHLEFRMKLGREFEREMGALSASFGFGRFALDQSVWLRRERAIITRLFREPFFKIKALVVWDLDRLREMAPKKPASKYAADIHFNPDLGRWERRITDRWDVFFNNNPGRLDGSFQTEKIQGLNLDTHRGFHFIERGLPLNVPSDAFREVSLTYPIFYSDTGTGAPDLRRLQETFIANLYFIYDPFSWVARRDVRFRGGFLKDCQDHVQAQRLRLNDRAWFDEVLARFLSDVVTIKLQGADEIYALHMLNKRLGESPRVLGVGLDLLNWNSGEKRTAPDRPETDARLSLTNSSGFRYVLIDAYQRHGDTFVEGLRRTLAAQKDAKEKISGRTLLTRLIADTSGLPFEEFAQRAKSTQEAHLNRHKLTRPPPERPAAATPATPAAP